MPTLDAANISFNLLKVAAGDNLTVGPILLGTAKPVHPDADRNRPPHRQHDGADRSGRGKYLIGHGAAQRGAAPQPVIIGSTSTEAADGDDQQRARPSSYPAVVPALPIRPVLTCICEMLPDPTINPFPIVCGTSAGAINAATIACQASNFGPPSRP